MPTILCSRDIYKNLGPKVKTNHVKQDYKMDLKMGLTNANLAKNLGQLGTFRETIMKTTNANLGFNLGLNKVATRKANVQKHLMTKLHMGFNLGLTDTNMQASGPQMKVDMHARQAKATENYLLAIPLLGTENCHVVDLAQPSKDVCLHLTEYSLYRMFQIQDLLQLSILDL